MLLLHLSKSDLLKALDCKIKNQTSYKIDFTSARLVNCQQFIRKFQCENVNDKTFPLTWILFLQI